MRRGALPCFFEKFRQEMPASAGGGRNKVSLWLGHARVLTPHRGVIHYARAASLPPLPYGGENKASEGTGYYKDKALFFQL